MGKGGGGELCRGGGGARWRSRSRSRRLKSLNPGFQERQILESGLVTLVEHRASGPARDRGDGRDRGSVPVPSLGASTSFAPSVAYLAALRARIILSINPISGSPVTSLNRCTEGTARPHCTRRTSLAQLSTLAAAVASRSGGALARPLLGALPSSSPSWSFRMRFCFAEVAFDRGELVAASPARAQLWPHRIGSEFSRQRAAGQAAPPTGTAHHMGGQLVPNTGVNTTRSRLGRTGQGQARCDAIWRPRIFLPQ